ncbi:MAG: VWA domain-containing protein [Methylocella sp.]
MNGWSFALPAALTLLPAPILAALARPARQTSPSGLRIPASIRDRFLARGNSGIRRTGAPTLAWFAWICLVVALAGPRVVAANPALPASGRDIMFALDLSGSMTIPDFTLDGVAASRLDALKRAGSELIRRREGDRIGVVIFADTAFAAAPLSFDVSAVGQTLNEMEIGLVGRSTAIGEGLGLALKRLAESKAPTRIIILLSDGANDAGSSDPGAVAALAKSLGVKIFTIGLGANDSLSAPDDPDAVDFVALQKLAEITGAAAFRAHTTDELAVAAHAIEALAAGPALAPPTVIYRDLWSYPAALAFAACFAIALSQRAPR